MTSTEKYLIVRQDLTERDLSPLTQDADDFYPVLKRGQRIRLYRAIPLPNGRFVCVGETADGDLWSLAQNQVDLEESAPA